MKPYNPRPLLSFLLLGWSIMFFLYALLGAFLGSGEDALSGPATPAENLLAALLLGYALLQLLLAIILHKKYQPALFWACASLGAVSVAAVVAPLLYLLLS